MPAKYGRKAPKENIGRMPRQVPRGRETDGHKYSDEEREFLMAIDRFKRENHCPNPSLADVLRIAKSLGYRRVTNATEPEVETVVGPGHLLHRASRQVGGGGQPDGREVV